MKRPAFDGVKLQDLNEIDLENLQKEPNLPFERRNPSIIERTKATTNKVKSELSVEELIETGIICIDKPKGPTSHQVSGYLQKVLKISKSGHSGTLDPKVGGVLPIALNKGTKVLQGLLKAGKEYICICHLHKEVDEQTIKEVISRFVGKIDQLPPIKSAIKRRRRTRNIYYINIIEIDGQDIMMRVGCQAGTYMRKLCSDIGEIIGCGAHMAALRRTKAGPFNEETNMVSLQTLQDAFYFYKKEGNEKLIRHCIHPLEKAVEHLPKVWVQDGAVKTVAHGASLKLPGVVKFTDNIEPDQLIAVMTLNDELVCLSEARMSSKKLKEAKRGIVCKSVKVLIDRKEYL